MAGKQYSLTPHKVPRVETRYRRIVTPIPAPRSLPILRDLRKYEPISMTGQPPVIWDRAEGVQVYDKWGNMWMDWSSGVLVTNAGHGNKAIVKAIVDQAQKPLLHNYCFPSELRARLARRLVEITPPKLAKAFILTTGAETTECAIKLARTHGQNVGGRKKIGIVSFHDAFHGRTLGAQMIGGSPALKQWIVNLDPSMWQVPFPDEHLAEDTSFQGFLDALKKLGVAPDMVAGVITETYQGGRASFAPKPYMQEMARWCAKHDVVLILDEVQAGFGRTGKKFGFEHYDIVPDIICCGKGISSSLPISAVLGRKDLMDQYPPGSMTSTHTASPVCAAAALASIDEIWRKKLWENAARMGEVMLAKLRALQDKHPQRIGHVYGKGLVAAIHMVARDGKTPDYGLAFDAVRRCMEKGLLLFSPVGASSIKIAPPLVTTRAQVLEGCEVMDEAIGEAIAASK